mgnify:CR=1 FL=1|jgi:hypothetical protein|tara:strand:+ start:25 stop:513 length:489 start_codon:yes stop_codon:yes gene_type:complete
MANISTYPIGTPAQGDLIPGTQKYTNANGKTENLTRNFTVANIAAFANSYSLGYTVYTALITQTGADAPVATVLQNTTGGTIVWTRNSTGRYLATISGATYTANKTAILLTSGSASATDGRFLKVEDSGNTTVQAFYNFDTSANTAQDGIVTGAMIEIRIYS